MSDKSFGLGQTSNTAEERQGATYKTILFVASGLTLMVVTWVPVIYLYLRAKYPHRVDQVSIRQMFAICLVNLLQTWIILIFTFSAFTGRVCRIFFWITISTRNFTSWTSFMVIFNLQLVVCHGFRNTKSIEPYYYIIPTVISIIPLAVTLATQQRIDLFIGSYCFNNDVSNPLPFILFWVRGYLYIILASVCSIVSLIIISIYIIQTHSSVIRNANTEILNQSNLNINIIPERGEAIIESRAASPNATLVPNEPQQRPYPGVPHIVGREIERARSLPLNSRASFREWFRSKKNSLVHRYHIIQHNYHIIAPVFYRLVWIPIVPIITSSVEIPSYTLQATDTRQRSWLNIWADTMFVLEGLFQAIPFYLDPAIIESLKVARKTAIFTYFYSPYKLLALSEMKDNEKMRSKFKRSTAQTVDQVIHVSRARSDSVFTQKFTSSPTFTNENTTPAAFYREGLSTTPGMNGGGGVGGLKNLEPYEFPPHSPHPDSSNQEQIAYRKTPAITTIIEDPNHDNASDTDDDESTSSTKSERRRKKRNTPRNYLQKPLPLTQKQQRQQLENYSDIELIFSRLQPFKQYIINRNPTDLLQTRRERALFYLVRMFLLTPNERRVVHSLTRKKLSHNHCTIGS
ncbi:hypothetical protein H4219_005281 [Mycoemilia scoparia]|uniref:Uncharacterized protein n=1 Tax=Mycoemilia scoparia TaxID=417184 RepID=A0A9W7ZV86_9FUNG|nr:hypothetical protein H4219_005281 [Mycoemilia scoparia]